MNSHLVEGDTLRNDDKLVLVAGDDRAAVTDS